VDQTSVGEFELIVRTVPRKGPEVQSLEMSSGKASMNDRHSKLRHVLHQTKMYAKGNKTSKLLSRTTLWGGNLLCGMIFWDF